MKTRNGRWIIGLAGVLLLTALAGDAAAASKPKLTARIHGKAFKATGTTRLQGTFISGELFSVLATTKSVRHNRAMDFACVGFGLAPGHIVALGPCGGEYQETNVSRHGVSVKTWSTVSGLQVTLDSFDGTHATGTVSGAFELSGQCDGPATVQNGRFDVVITNTGG